MLVTVILIVGLEILAVCSFILGFILGKHSKKETISYTSPSISLNDDLLDPVTPEEQMLMRKLEMEEKSYVNTSED